jgi:NAD(P)H-hydrate epimerase
MENAGRSAADILRTLQPAPPQNPALVLCGPGNNGGDGFVVARHLDGAGWPVVVVLAADPGRLKGDALFHWQILARSGIPVISAEDFLASSPGQSKPWADSSWIIDGLFGTGLNRALGEPFASLIERVNQSGVKVLAIDLPSGLDGDTGQPLGPTIKATHTVCMVAMRKGLTTHHSREFTGRIHVGEIGLPAWKMNLSTPTLAKRGESGRINSGSTEKTSGEST